VRYLLIAAFFLGCSSITKRECEDLVNVKRNKIMAMSLENDAKIDSLRLKIEEKQCQIDSILAKLRSDQ